MTGDRLQGVFSNKVRHPFSASNLIDIDDVKLMLYNWVITSSLVLVARPDTEWCRVVIVLPLSDCSPLSASTELTLVHVVMHTGKTSLFIPRAVKS